MSCGLASDLFVDRELVEPLLEGDHALFHYASSWALPFFALVVSYGIVIPSGLKRCGIMVVLMTIPPLVITTVAAVFEGGLTPSFAISFLLQFALWMGLACGIAVFGAHRIEVLRQNIIAARKLGPYQITRQLTQGGMGEVYLARHELLRRPCAIKLIRRDRMGDRSLVRLFEREVRTLASLRHPNTVQVFDYGRDDDGTFYYVMEYLDGPTLQSVVSTGGPMNPERVVRVLHQLCGAIGELHDHGLIHRDVKPDNVILLDLGGANDVVKLLDFGLTQGVGIDAKAHAQGGITGTPAFMSPEQCGNQELDNRSDIYAFGALAYFLVTGQPPFVRSTIGETLHAHRQESVMPDPMRATIPNGLKAIILRCLATDRARRYETMSEVQTVLSGLDGRTTD